MEDWMNGYQVIAMPTKVAELVRSTRRSPGYGHPASTELASGYGPCRHCLRFFREGEERRTLFTYNPFHGKNMEPLPGPVFIHAEACERYEPEAGFPQHLSGHALTLVGYGEGRRWIAERRMGVQENAESHVRELLSDPDVLFLHVRDTEAGCYDFCIERA
jgi:Protein of unknown function (DUF1203)